MSEAPNHPPDRVALILIAVLALLVLPFTYYPLRQLLVYLFGGS